MIQKFFKCFKGKPVVGVLHLKGIISPESDSMRKTALNIHNLEDSIEDIFQNKRNVAVALLINCPGGSPVQSKYIANRIMHCAKKHNKPVFSFCEDVAASGGYWLAIAADEIYADESSIIGSIGVISAGFGFTELIKKIGVERRVYTSGNNKSNLDPFLPENKTDIERLKAVQKDVHDQFINTVKQRRGDKINGKDEELFSGNWYSGIGALERGLIDHFGELHHTCTQKYGDDVKFKHYKISKKGFSRFFTMLPQMFIDRIEEKIMRSYYGV